MTTETSGGSSTQLPGLLLVQELTAIINRFRVHELGPDQSPGALLAYGEQKPLKLREEVTFFANDAKTQPLFAMRSREIVDLHATTAVVDAAGASLGSFRKDARRSLTNSTYYLQTPDGQTATGRERNAKVAAIRRFGFLLPGALGDAMDLLPWQFHFDFRDDHGQVVLACERRRAFSDQYLVTLPPRADGPPIDWRLAAAVGVALDVFQGR
ncbi:MAG: hypothetical protein IPI32_01880 [Austwickia sp.]|nr:hypothetical protein [Austwickia sp.]MBK8437708.1 hypothetical protein [Austwickia sp.]MBK9100019.1 hypothetical protein [Austwickia sp.]